MASPCLIGKVAGERSDASSSQPPTVDPHAIAAFVEIVFDCCNGQLPYRGLRDKGTGQESETHHKWIDLSRPNVVKRQAKRILALGTHAKQDLIILDSEDIPEIPTNS